MKDKTPFLVCFSIVLAAFLTFTICNAQANQKYHHDMQYQFEKLNNVQTDVHTLISLEQGSVDCNDLIAASSKTDCAEHNRLQR